MFAYLSVQTTSELRGELMISMCYNNHLERITVGIFEGRGLVGEASSSPIGDCLFAIISSDNYGNIQCYRLFVVYKTGRFAEYL